MESDTLEVSSSPGNCTFSMKGDERFDNTSSGVLGWVGTLSVRWSKECFAAFNVEVSVLPLQVHIISVMPVLQPCNTLTLEYSSAT